jgi:hypothetical protein
MKVVRSAFRTAARTDPDPLEAALAIENELAALYRAEVHVPHGAPYVVEWRDDGTIAISRPGEEVSVFDARECADDLANDNFHEFAPEDAALLRTAVHSAYLRSIQLHEALFREVGRLREHGDRRELARKLVAEDDARLSALDEQRRREAAAIARRRTARRWSALRSTARAALVLVGVVVSLLVVAELLGRC